MKKWFLCCVAVLLLAKMVHAQTCDNPTGTAAYTGFGSTTLGGKDKPVYRVTTLANTGPGSLRDALSAGNRCIVFDVAGLIPLTDTINVRQPFITIDGYSAPGPVVIQNYGINLIGPNDPNRTGGQAHDVIIRGLKFHPTDNTRGVDVDSVGIDWGTYNVVVHGNTFYGPLQSPTNTTDEHVSIGTGSRDITVSWNLLGRAPGGGTTQLLLIDARATRVSVHHNLLWDSADKIPTIVADIHSSYVDTGTTVDFRYNAMFHKNGGEGSVFSDGANVNIVGNWFGYMPTERPLDYRLLITCNRARLAALGNPPYAVQWCNSQGAPTNVRHDGQFYVTGNATTETIPAAYPQDINQWGTVATPFDAPSLPDQTALEAYCQVYKLAGRRPLGVEEQALFDRIPAPSTCPTVEVVNPAPLATTTVGLAWDHDGVGLNLAPSGFVLERKLGTTGAYAQVGTLINPTDRTVVDTIVAGQLYCWQVRAKNAFFTSDPSNEVCLIEATRPINLRIQ